MQSALLTSKMRGMQCWYAISEVAEVSSKLAYHTTLSNKDSCSIERPTEANDKSCAAYLEIGSANCPALSADIVQNVQHDDMGL